MKKSAIVIGSNFGDEGKGRTIFDLASTAIDHSESVCVVRFNGGCQAGHTTFHQGQRRVWHQFGSASDLGAATYFGPKMIVSPFMFWDEILNKNLYPGPYVVYVDRHCLVSLYIDQIINRLVEEARGSDRHGSCGGGINETVERSFSKYRIEFWEIGGSNFRQRMYDCWQEYGPTRLRFYNCDHLIDKYFNEVTEDIVNSNIDDCEAMFDRTKMVFSFLDIKNHYDVFLFEGAQGLMLSETNMSMFPHLTRSITGASNALDVLNLLDARQQPESIPLYYVTRPYLTRHGAGMLWNESTSGEFDWVRDDTNISNPWQGSLRFAPLNIPMMLKFINEDLRLVQSKSKVRLDPHLVVTCWDQTIGRTLPLVNAFGELVHVNSREFSYLLQVTQPYPTIFKSMGVLE